MVKYLKNRFISLRIIKLILIIFILVINTNITKAENTIYGYFDEETKSISFAVYPKENYVEVNSLKTFISNYKEDVVSVDFACEDEEGNSVKIPVDEANALFRQSPNLVNVYNLSNLDISNVTSLRSMFSQCSKLESIDFRGLDTSHIENFRSLFYQCYELKEVNLEGMDTSSATDMALMFYFCSKLENLDVSSFDTSNVRSFYFMFGYCSSLKRLDLKHFDTRNVASDSVTDYPGFTAIFYSCVNLEYLDISNFTTNMGSGYLQNAFPFTHSLRTLILGENIILEDSSRFGPTGITGSWYDENGKLFNAYELRNTYDGSTMAGTYKRHISEYDPNDHIYRTDGTLNKDNLWEVHSPNNRFKGYCLNKYRSGVAPVLDRVEVLSDQDLINVFSTEHANHSHGYAPLGNSMKEAMVTIMYYGWPNNAAGIQERHNLTDDEFMEVTQRMIWDFADMYNNKSSQDEWNDNLKQAYQELLNQRYANIGKEYYLYVYKTQDPSYQSLISLRSLSLEHYGGVEISKEDYNGDPLSGAIFSIYNLNDEEVATITTDENGIAIICETDSYSGLPLGEYYILEKEAPKGYIKSDEYYRFTIDEPDEIVKVGLLNNEGEEVEMVFVNRYDPSYHGGGIRVYKQSSKGKALMTAEFTIYKDGVEFLKIISNNEGYAYTGNRDLPVGTYTIKETKAPNGYYLSSEEYTFEITNSGEYYSETFTFTDEVKYGSVIIEAKKIMENYELKEGDFKFQLLDINGNLLQEKTNDKDGKIVFDKIEYTSDDLGYVNYKIVEVNDNKKDIEYDKHEEIITVTIVDTGEDILHCSAIYDADNAVFKNKYVEEPKKPDNRREVPNTSSK